MGTLIVTLLLAAGFGGPVCEPPGIHWECKTGGDEVAVACVESCGDEGETLFYACHTVPVCWDEP